LDLNQRESVSKVVDVALAEFNALRAEINQRIAAEATLDGLNFTVSATVVGLVLAEKVGVNVLVILPILYSGVKILAMQQNFVVIAAGKYIREQIAPLVREKLGDDRLFDWERFYAEDLARRRYWWLSPVASLLIFPAFSVAIIVLVVPDLTRPLEWTAWLVGIVAITCQSIMAGRWTWRLYMARRARKP
jgi:hypothetical protein